MKNQEFFECLSREKPRRILIIPFEDASLPESLRQLLPGTSIDILHKQDLSGIPISGMASKLRRERWDVVVCSLYKATVNRSRASVELLLGLARARRRYLRLAEEDFEEITTLQLLLTLLPRLFVTLIAGGLYVCALYAVQLTIPLRSRHTLPAFVRGTILFLRTDLPGELKAGGSVSHITGMIKAFRDCGFRVVYIADARIASLPEDVVQEVVSPIAAFAVFDELQLIAYNFQLLRRTSDWVRKYRPVLVYQRHGILNIAGGLVARSAGVPFVLEANASEVWVKSNWSRLFFKGLARHCEAWALELADRVTVISQGVREQLGSYHVPEHKFVLNPNGVDPTEFNPTVDGSGVREKYGLRNRIVVGFIGTFTRWHGVETLFEAATIVAQRRQEVVFLLIGDGELRSNLENRAKREGLERSIVFTGTVPHKEAPQYLAACDILVSPHLGFENNVRFFGSPTKLFEYMAMGKAIVASNLEQIGEVIEDEVTGFLFWPGDATSLAEKILILAHDEQLRISFGTKARAVVQRKHTWLQNVQQIVSELETEL